MEDQYTIISWNVDRYDWNIHNWLLKFVETYRPDVIFLSEIKISKEQMLTFCNLFLDYNAIINAHQPSRWHGVAMLIRKDHSYQHLDVSMNIPARKDTNSNEAGNGRLIAINLNEHLFIIGTYTPNSGRSDQLKLEYRTKIWDPAFNHLLEIFRSHGHTIWLGDINVALNEIDVSNPSGMKTYAGFTPEERSNLKSLLDTNNWIDIWRSQHPNDRIYTWLGYPHRSGYGMRLDNIIGSSSIQPLIQNSFMINDSPSDSDHIAIGIQLTKP